MHPLHCRRPIISWPYFACFPPFLYPQVATCGDLVAVGSADQVVLLDTRVPNGGITRNTSSVGVGHKRSRVSGSGFPKRDMHSGQWDQYTRTAAAAAAEADEVPSASMARSRHALWRVVPNCLPPAYRPDRNRPVQPVVLAVAGPVPGMQELQRTCAAAGIDPMLADQALRREAAAAAVSHRRSFDSALEGVSTLRQQWACMHTCSHGETIVHRVYGLCVVLCQLRVPRL